MSSKLFLKSSLLRRVGRPGIVGLIALALFVLTLRHHLTLRNHYVDVQNPLDRTESLPSHNWTASCREHGFPSFDRPRKVFDLVLFNTELDWLEIRLHTHAPYVDYFVIVESPTTFTNEPKPLVLQENWERYKQFHHKIIYRTIEDTVVSTNPWDHEAYLRNALLKEVFPELAGQPEAALTDDVLIVSDMDELIRPGALLIMRHCAFPKRLTLRSHFYYYSYQWLHQGKQWAHPQATTFGTSIENTLAPNDLRMNRLGSGLLPSAALSWWLDSATLWNAGWHCSSCFSSIAEMQTKMQSFSHQNWNTQENREAETILYRVRNGLDLFARPSERYDRVNDNTDVPPYVLDAFRNDGRFKYLLDRDGSDAGFEDVTTGLPK